MMANFFTQLVQRAQGAIPVAQPLIVPRFAPSMAIAGDFLEFSTFEPSSMGQKTKIDLDRKPDTLSSENESTVTPDIVELMPSLPPGHWSANRSRLHQIQILEPFEPFEFNDFKEGRRELVEETSISASEAPESQINRSPLIDKLPPTSAEATPTVSPATEILSQANNSLSQQQVDVSGSNSPKPLISQESNTSFSASNTPENHSTRSPVTENLPPTSQQPAVSSKTQLPSQRDRPPSKQQVPPPQLMPQESNTSFSASNTPENHSTRSPVTENLPPSSQQPAATHSAETELLSQGDRSPSKQQVPPPQLMPQEENTSFSASNMPENHSTRSPVTENLPPTSQQPAASPKTQLSSQRDRPPSKQQVDADVSISPPQLMPQVEKTSISASLAPENHSQQQVDVSGSNSPKPLIPQGSNNSFRTSEAPESQINRSPVTENLPSTSQQPAPAVYPYTDIKLPSELISEGTDTEIHRSPGEEKITSINANRYELSSQADNYPSKQPNNLKPTIFPQKPQPQVKSKSSEDRSLSQSIPPLNNSERSSLVQKPYKVSTQPIQEVSRSNQFSSKLNNSRSQPSKEPIKNSSTTSPQTPGRQKAIGYTQQNIQETVPRSPFPISDNVKKSHIYPQQQLSSASGSRKTALVKPLVDRANTQHSQSSTNLDSTEVPPKKIEINIGRIIVRAADRPPTPPKSRNKRSKHKKPALSLSDYLQQRRTENKGGRQ